MKLLRRDTVEFQYRPYSGALEGQTDERHTGNYEPEYGYPVTYRGNISPPGDSMSNRLFGRNGNYTHVLLMDNPKANILESGIIEWNNGVYEIYAISRSKNFMHVALRKKTVNHAMLTGGVENAW